MNITHCHLKALSVDLLATIVVSCTKKRIKKKTTTTSKSRILAVYFQMSMVMIGGSCFA